MQNTEEIKEIRVGNRTAENMNGRKYKHMDEL
jgi:hypothetical protein